jgi:F1F0 ATPase subunit 2
VSLVLSFAAGAVLGAAYLYALWFSVQRLSQARRPGAWLISGAGLRTVAVVGAFYLVMDGRWERLLACLAGFVLVRLILLRKLRPRPSAGSLEAQP